METRIIIAGSGGQGVLFLGKLMAHSAMLEGKEVTWFPSYGAEMRGGTANCTVIISDEMIGSPVTRNPHLLVTMNEASYRRFSDRLLEDGLLLYDSSLVAIREHRDDIRAIGIPASGMAATSKHTKSANMAMMGAVSAAARILKLASVLKALDETTPSRRKDSLAVNKDLITKGYEFIENKKSDHR